MKVVSFFSGLGGLDKGFVDTGYDDVHVVQDLCRNDRVVYGRYHRK